MSATDIRFGTQAIIQNDAGELLLILREDFNVWTFPGGSLDVGETFETGAIREAKEETGIDVELTGIQTIYTSDSGRSYGVIFTAKPIGGEITRSFESKDVQYFLPENIPDNRVPWLNATIDEFTSGKRNQLAVRRLSFRMQIYITVGVFIRDLRNRYILRNPTPDPDYFSLTVYGMVNGNRILEMGAIRGQVIWKRLLTIANAKSKQNYAVESFGSIRMDVENRHAFMTVNLKEI